MADICVIYADEDKAIIKKLVSLLRMNWSVWWGGEIAEGDWEMQVRAEISNSKAIIPVFSHHTENKPIFKDELRLAEKQKRIIFPFLIEDVEIPLGFGHLNRTDAFGWSGDENHPGYIQLKQKIITKLGEKNLKRISALQLNKKKLDLPGFVFSLSSFETQVHPKDGVKLFELLKPSAILISAYDAWDYQKDSDKSFFNNVNELRRQSNCIIFLDSGNYEAYRKKDQYSEKNKNGWQPDYFRQIALKLSPDIAFAFDESDPKGDPEEVANQIINNFHEDEKALYPQNFPLCPIIHLPKKKKYEDLVDCAIQIITKVTSALSPVMVAIPERELGDGIIERFMTVRDIRRALNNLGKYYPLHLLGTGNPISITAFALAGADSFDGLEWCRTVADYEKGYLFHFQHFDCFQQRFSSVQSQEVRAIIEDPLASYGAKVLCYNIDFFNDWIKGIQKNISSEKEETLYANVPNIGTILFKELQNEKK